MRLTYTTLGKDLIERRSEEDVLRQKSESVLIACISIVLFLMAGLISQYLSGKNVSGEFILSNISLGTVATATVFIFRSNTVKYMLSDKYKYNVCNFDAAEFSEYYLQVDTSCIMFTYVTDMRNFIFNEDITIKFEDIDYSVYQEHGERVHTAGRSAKYLKIVTKESDKGLLAFFYKRKRSLVINLRAYNAEEILNIEDIRLKIKLKQ